MQQRQNRPHAELPFEPQPHVDHDAQARHDQREDRCIDQLARNLGSHAFDAGKGHRGIDGRAQHLFHLPDLLGRDGLRLILCRDADHRDMLVLGEIRVEDLGDRHIAQGQALQRLAIGPHIHRHGRLRADRGPALEVDPVIQPHHRPCDDGQHRQEQRPAEGQPLPAEEVEIRLVGCQLETPCHDPVPLIRPASSACAGCTSRSRSAASR